MLFFLSIGVKEKIAKLAQFNHKMTEIVYPQGCKPIGEDLGPDELIRRLKVRYYL